MENSEMFVSQFGAFKPDGRSYIVKRVDTPRPWLNYLSNNEYGVCLSQNGYGFSFYLSAFDIRVTHIDIFGYVPTHPQTGRFVYLHDVDSGQNWPLMPMGVVEAAEYQDYQCEHGLGFSRMQAARDGIAGEFTIFVPRQDPVEMWRIRLANNTKRTRRVRIFPYVEMSMKCASGITDVLTFTRGTWRNDLKAAVIKMTNTTAPFVYDAFMCTDYDPLGFECRRESFLGTGRTILNPLVPETGVCLNSSVSAEQMCTVIAGELILKPGEEKCLHVVVGVSRKDSDIKRFKRKYCDKPDAWQKEFDSVKKYWNANIGQSLVQSPSPLFDLHTNIWFKYQNYVTSRWCRGSDKGYRDVLQDIMGFAAVDPAWARRWLRETLSQMYQSGLCPRGYCTYGGSDDLRLHRDSPLWIPLACDEYLRQSGDLDFLMEVLPYKDGDKGSVWEHILRGLNRLFTERGQHGLCLIGDGDWNDSLNEVALEGKGVSAWLTIGTIFAMQVTLKIADAINDQATVRLLQRRVKILERAVNKSAWDGNWYLYAFDDHGKRIGSKNNHEGKIHLNCQTWAIFAGIARGERLKKLLATVDKQLDTEFGPILIHPAYTKYQAGIGKVSGKNPGTAENGPIYMHGAAFKILADCMLGRGDKALETLERVLPQSRWNTPEWHGGEPFASHRYLIGPGCKERFGQSSYPWFCAWQAWMSVIAAQWILGIRPDYKGLVIDPCIPENWEKFNYTFNWRGCIYKITVENPEGVSTGIKEIYVDGKLLRGTTLPLPDGKTTKYYILAVMGKGGTRTFNPEYAF